MEKIKPSLTSVFFIVLTLLFIISCSGHQLQKTQTIGVYHVVKKNETVLMIANAYHVRLQNLAKMNKTTDLNLIKEGDVLFIPDTNQIIDDVTTNVKKTMNTAAGVKTKKGISGNAKYLAKNQDVKKDANPVKEASIAVYKKEALPVMQPSIRKQPKVAVPAKPAQVKTFPEKNIPEGRVEFKSKVKYSEGEIKINKNKFIWPVRGIVKTSFGIQPNKTSHNWIKIVSPAKTKVRAAASGTVIFSSALKIFGETIIIRHKDNFSTVYTHLKKRYVRTDQNVKKGEAIAVVGETDDAGDTYINFEIRLKGKARNPLFFLP